jgi:hypothetical protein
MADEGGAVAEAPVVDAGGDTGEFSEGAESTQSTVKTPEQEAAEKLDGRKQPDGLKKRIASLRSQADAETDPVAKAAILADAKELNNKVGKVGAYEQLYPTVREARESKTLIDSLGGRDGLIKQQETIARVQQIDNELQSGNPAAIEALWKEAPEGMVKLAPMIFDRLAKDNPAEYAKAVAPHAVKFLDSSGFPEAYDKMVTAYQNGDKATGDDLSAKLARWVASQRGNAQREPQVDPRVKELETKLSETQTAEQKRATDAAYSDVVTHAGPVIDKYLKPMVAKLGLTAEQYKDLREDTWKHLQDTRNADATYKTVAAAKMKLGMDKAAEYIKGETEARANDAARAMAQRRYGHQLKNGAATVKPNATATPIAPGVTRGKEPSPSEIDYGPKGIQAAKKAGFKDLSDMILSGKAPLKVGGIRQWR